jgi:hypothetical protein
VLLEWGRVVVPACMPWRPRRHHDGVDISAKNLEETGRVLAEFPGSEFVPILLEGDPSTVGAIDRPVDLFFSTAVFPHFPARSTERRCSRRCAR